MKNITKEIETSLKNMMSAFSSLEKDASDAYDAYWDTDANSKITAAGSSDQVIVTPQVIKNDYLNGITLCQNIGKFFNNTALSAVDHLAYSNLFKFGTYFATPISAELSPATGAVGAIIESVSCTCIRLLEEARLNLNLYNDNELSDIVAVLDGERIIYGSSMTRNDLANAITLLQQWEKFMTAQTVTTADYSVTVSKWLLY